MFHENVPNLIPKWYKFDDLFKSRILLVGLIVFFVFFFFTIYNNLQCLPVKKKKSLVIYALDSGREAVDVRNEWVDPN